MKRNLSIVLFLFMFYCLVSQSLTLAERAENVLPTQSENSHKFTLEQVQTPVFDPPGGIYCTQQLIDITTDTSEAVIRYTLDGTDPDPAGIIFTGPIVIPLNSTYTFKARAFKAGYDPSEIATATYTILNPAFPVQITSEPTGAAIWIDDEFSGQVTPYTFWQNCLSDADYSVRLAGYSWEPASFEVIHIQASEAQHFIVTLVNPPIVPGVSQNIGGPNFYIAEITVQTPPDTGFNINYETVNINTIPPQNLNNGLSYHNSYAVIFSGPNDEWFDLAVTVPAGIWWICAWYGGSWHTAVPDYPYIGDEPGTVYLMHVQFGGTKGLAYMVVAQGENLDPTLPVELSSFTALTSSGNWVDISWTSQSESNLSGYYIIRNKYADLSNASTVSGHIPATNTSQTANYSYMDNEVEPGGSYFYWLQIGELDGNTSLYGPVGITLTPPQDGGEPIVPLVTKLLGVYPNPFNPAAFVNYQLETPASVEFNVYNNKGQRVRSYMRQHDQAGTFNLMFNGLDEAGKALASGVYYCRMTCGRYTSITKLVLLK